MTQSAGRIEPLSTRLFPQGLGADQYRITGIAARCDWIVNSDPQAPKVDLKRRSPAARKVYLSLRAPVDALRFFVDEVMPRIEGRFVLVSGSEDVTLPRQLDERWPRFSSDNVARILSILDDDRLIHWFAENLDDATFHRKLSPLPVGMVTTDPDNETVVQVPTIPPLGERPLRMLCAHRVRRGPRWEIRRAITRLCAEQLSDTCTVVTEEAPISEYITRIHEHAFVLCASGGGLDPSPKAWLSILHGAIPIVLRSSLDAAYARLPVAFVDAWEPSRLALPQLRAWRHQFSPCHDTQRGRTETLRRLGMDYWWGQVEEALASVESSSADTR